MCLVMERMKVNLGPPADQIKLDQIREYVRSQGQDANVWKHLITLGRTNDLLISYAIGTIGVSCYSV